MKLNFRRESSANGRRPAPAANAKGRRLRATTPGLSTPKLDMTAAVVIRQARVEGLYQG